MAFSYAEWSIDVPKWLEVRRVVALGVCLALAIGSSVLVLPGGVRLGKAAPWQATETAAPAGCASQTPSPTPSPTPTSYRVFDARADLASSAPRARRGETIVLMVRGYSPFAYLLRSSQLAGLRPTGVYTWTASGGAWPPCSVEGSGFSCRDDSQRTVGPVQLFVEMELVASTGAMARACAVIESRAPFDSGHDSDRSNDQDCVAVEVLPGALGRLDRLDDRRARAPDLIARWSSGQGRMADDPQQATATPTRSPTVDPSSTPSPTSGPPPVCASPTSTATPSPTPTSVRVYDASLEAWSSAPAVWPGDRLSLVLKADLNLKWRIEGEMEGDEGLRLTGAYTFTRGAGPPPRRCEVEEGAFRCWLDLPEAIASGGEVLFLDAEVDEDAAPGRTRLCAQVSIEAPRGQGGDPNASNDRSCAQVRILPAGAPRPTARATTPGPSPGPEETPSPTGSTTPEPTVPTRLWLPRLDSGPVDQGSSRRARRARSRSSSASAFSARCSAASALRSAGNSRDLVPDS